MARSQTDFLTSIYGRRLALSPAGNLVSGEGSIGRNLSMPCVHATITVGAEGASVADQRAITIQLLDAYGRDIDYVEEVEVHMFLDAGRLAYVVTGGSTGIAIGTDGALLALVAKKVFVVTSEADGDIDLTWTDTGTEAAFLGLKLPAGNFIMSSALANT